MKRSLEIQRKITELKNEMKTLQANGHVEDAYNKLEDLKKLEKEFEIANELEKEEVNNFAGQTVEPINKKDIDINKVFNKLVIGKPVTEAEMEAYNLASTGQIEHTPEKGGYLVPEEQGKTLKEFRRFEISLKEFCNVVPVTTVSGKFPVANQQKGKLVNFEELTEIGQTDITFAQQNWSVKDYGDIIPVSNTLLDDTAFPLVNIVGKNFTKKSVNTENDEILKLLKTTNKKVTGKTYKDIKTVLNKTLDPAIAQTAIIITNQSGFDYLDKLEDDNKHPLLTDDLANPTQKLFKGKRIVVLTDEMLPQDSKKYPFYIGDLSEFINFYDREGVEVAKSTEAGFTKNATLLRAIERFDVKIVDKEAVVYLTIPEASEA